MKNIYLSILCISAFGLCTNAQEIFNTDFSEASYDVAEVQTDLDAHPDWRADHFTNTNATATWNANTNDQILTGSNFAYSILNVPITAVDGDVITITSVIMLGFDNQAFDTTQDRTMVLVGLSPEAAPTQSSVLGASREGVSVRTLFDGSGTIDLSNAGGTGNFTTNPSISQADKSAYEVIIEYTIGADAASSSKSVRLRNVGTSNETSSIESLGGIRDEIYTAFTGTGAYYFNWALQFSQAGAGNINRIVNNRVNITRDSAVLSTPEVTITPEAFILYPNPVNDQLHIRSNAAVEKIEIFDYLGRTVLSTKNASDAINVSSLKSSAYIIRLTTANGVESKKFIKN